MTPVIMTQQQIMAQAAIVKELARLVRIAEAEYLVIAEDIQSVVDGAVFPECAERIAA